MGSKIAPQISMNSVFGAWGPLIVSLLANFFGVPLPLGRNLEINGFFTFSHN